MFTSGFRFSPTFDDNSGGDGSMNAVQSARRLRESAVEGLPIQSPINALVVIVER
jgi:hypothetical protein